MPAPVYVTLSPEQDEALLRPSRRSDLAPRTRARVEALRRSNKRWQAQQIAAHLGIHLETVRRALKRFSTAGVEGLLPKAGRKLEPVITPEMLDPLKGLLETHAARATPRTDTAPDLVLVLKEEFSLSVHRQTVRRAMTKLGDRDKRTRFVPAKQPDPETYPQTAERLESLQARGEPLQPS